MFLSKLHHALMHHAKALLQLLLGLFIAAIGTVFMLHADIGLFPWGTLQEGLSRSTGISFGVWSQLVGFAIIVGLMYFKYVPGIGTFVDILFFGFFVDFLNWTHIIPSPSGFLLQAAFSLVGLFILSYGMAVYMRCGLGVGPRDGLLLFLMERTGKSVTAVKSLIEVTVTVLGLLLGGPFGAGTLALALLGGKVLEWVFRWTRYNPNDVKQLTLGDFFGQLPDELPSKLES